MAEFDRSDPAAGSDDLVWWSATETAARVVARTISAVEVIDAHLARVAAVNGQINAING